VKQLHARAAVAVFAPVGPCVALLTDVEGYPRWYPDGISSVVVLERAGDGAARRVAARVRLAQGPMQREWDLTMRVERPAAQRVRLQREPEGPGDRERFGVTWIITDGQIELELDAHLDVPRFLPVGRVGDALARGFVDAASRALS
jgi:hypothetical protein